MLSQGGGLYCFSLDKQHPVFFLLETWVSLVYLLRLWQSSYPTNLRRLVYVSTHVFILASNIPTEVCPSQCSSSSSSSSCPGSPDRGSSRGTRAVQVEMALSSSSRARYRGTWRAMSSTAETRSNAQLVSVLYELLYWPCMQCGLFKPLQNNISEQIKWWAKHWKYNLSGGNKLNGGGNISPTYMKCMWSNTLLWATILQAL